ncbi:MAG TPA: phosphoribosylformylglycinamidine synthase subunit PurL, partial [Acidimicrobiales bacterium]|nr:phosphoribosylformylglycinamidine synthase subunit PurL [Acidimicrobiales bacterium]
GTGSGPGAAPTVMGMGDPLHRELGLTDGEAQAIDKALGRHPNHLELAMYAVMWSEHCSYKSSRTHLRRLPTQGPGVLVGPGENAGVVDAGDGLAVAIRIESHNHPSAIEPYQGAATGVGGIIRDIFTMGARPVALMDPLRFGPLDEPRNRWLASGVVSGISGYGNAVGVPTVGGELEFAECYSGNPLVNVLCCGVLPKERLVLGRAVGEGNLAVLLGSTTGRDGIGGVSVLASAAFSEDPEAEAAKRPNVQVGDPFEEKRLIEATLELLDRHLVVGIQDLGGAGLTCATSETASRGGVGMDVNVAAVPRREPGLAPFEVMTSESQERMLAIVTPAALGEVVEVCRRWEVRATVVGRVTAGGRLRVLDGWDGPVLADVPAASLHEDAPAYDRPRCRPAWLDGWAADDPALLPAPASTGGMEEELLGLLADPAWAFRQYDHQLFLNTVLAPGADAAVLRLSAPGARPPAGAPPRGIALSTDGNPRWCALDPRAGTRLLVAESALNVACAGARPVALVNCLNFGNPEHPEVMWQLSEAIDGLAEACRALGIPVVGGNVSLYNESRGSDIHPTPVVGTLGLIEHLSPAIPTPVLVEGSHLLLIGATSTSLAGSRWAASRGHLGGRLPSLDLDLHARLLTLVAGLVNERLVDGIHDISAGGLGLALAEMAVKGAIGCRAGGVDDHEQLFGEGPSRVLASVAPRHLLAVTARAAAAHLPCREIGVGGGDSIVVEGLLSLSLERAREAWDCALPSALSGA